MSDVTSTRSRLANLLAALVLLGPLAAAQLTIDFTATPTSGVNPLHVTFDATASGGTPSAWLWSFGDGTSGTGQVVDHVYTGDGTFTVSLTVFTGFTPTSVQKPDLVVVAPAPLTPSFTVSPSSGANPLTVAFTDSSSGVAPTAWRWDFGDGATSHEQHPLHVYDTPGSYDVELTVSFGQQDEAVVHEAAVVVQPAVIVPDFTADVTSGANPLTVAFSDTTVGPADAWHWSFGDGATSDERHPVHAYTTPGAYDVTLDVALGGQVESVVKPGFVVVDPAPLVADFGADATSGVNPMTVAFEDLSDGALVDSWAWVFGDGLGESTEPNPVFTFTVPGVHDVSLTVTVGGQTETVVTSGFIAVAPAPLVASFTSDVTAGTNPLEVSFVDTSAGGAIETWAWDLGDGTTSSAQHPVHFYDTPGTYDVSLAVTIGVQVESVVAESYVTVEPAALDAAFVASPLVGVWPLDVTFEDTTGNPDVTSVRWDFGDGTTSTATSPVHTYTAPGDYTVTLDVELGGQTSTATTLQAVVALDVPECAKSDAIAVGPSPWMPVAVDSGRAVAWDALWHEILVFDVASWSVERTITTGIQWIRSGLDIDGGLIAIGGLDLAEGSGAVLLYDALTGELLSTITPPAPDVTMFGQALALHDGLLAIGAEHNAIIEERAYLYDVSDPLAPTLVSEVIPAEAVSWGLGVGCALHGDRLLLGSNQLWLGHGLAHAFLFDVSDPSEPQQVATITKANSNAVGFGYALAMSDTAAVVGHSASLDVLILDRETGAVVDELGPVFSQESAGFGSAVALDGPRLLVGVPAHGPFGASPGAAYLYDIDAAEFVARFVVPDGADFDQLGTTVALDPAGVVLGVPGEAHAAGAGVVRRFATPDTTWSDVGGGTPGAPAAELSGFGDVGPGCDVALAVSGAAPSSPGTLVIGFAEGATPSVGGVLVPTPDVRVPIATDAAGRVEFVEQVPISVALTTPLWFQYWFADEGTPPGIAATNALRATPGG